MSNIIVLYDLPCKGRNSCWSLNPWKTRLALNFKGLEYTTQWVEYPDIKDTLSALGIPPATPTPPTTHEYSIPALKLDSNTALMDSLPIARALEAAYPSPSLLLDHPIVAEVQALVFKCMRPLFAEILPLVPKNVLSEGSMEYWVRKRTKEFGQDLDEVRKEKGGQQCWDRAQPGLEEVAALLRKEKGPYFLGKEACYADLVWAGAVQFVRRVSEEAYEKLIGVDEVLSKQYEACGKWLEKDD